MQNKKQLYRYPKLLILLYAMIVLISSFHSRPLASAAGSSPLQVISLMDSGWTDLYNEGRVRVDYSNYLTGNGSLRFDHSMDGNFTGAYLQLPWQNLSNKGFKLSFKTASWERLESFLIGFCSDEAFEKNFNHFYYIDLKYYLTSIRDNEWNSITLSQSNLFAAGFPSWKNIGSIFIRTFSSQQPTPTLWIDEISTFDTGPTKGVVIAYDDGHRSAYTKGKITMDKYGFPGAMFIIPSYINQPGFMNSLQLQDMARSGWDIGGHSDYLLLSLPDELLEKDIRDTQSYLKALGYPGYQFYAIPYGEYNEKVIQVLNKYFPYIRPNYALHQPGGYAISDKLNSQVVSLYTPPEIIIEWIDQANKNNDLLILVFHKVEEYPIYDTEYSLANFIRVLDYLKNNKIPVTTLSEYFNPKP
jgi:peptidoglycan/xylan/chitin deacetylase (PgdA/CDA1 family)